MASLWARDGPTAQQSAMHQATTLTVVGISALALATVLSVYAIIQTSRHKRKLAEAKAQAIAELKQRYKDSQQERHQQRRMYQAPRVGDPHGKVTPSLKQGSFNVDLPTEEPPRRSTDMIQLRTPRSSQDVFGRNARWGLPEPVTSRQPPPTSGRQELNVLSAMVRSASSLSEGLVNLVVRRPEKAQLKSILLPSPQPSRSSVHDEGRFASRSTRLSPPTTAGLLRPPTAPPSRHVSGSHAPMPSNRGLGQLPPTPTRASSLSGHAGEAPLTPVLDLDIELATTGKGNRRLNTAEGREFKREKNRWLLGVRDVFDGPVSPAATDLTHELPFGPGPGPARAHLDIPGGGQARHGLQLAQQRRSPSPSPSPSPGSGATYADFRPLSLGFTPSSSSRSILSLTLARSEPEPKRGDAASSWSSSALQGVFDVSRSASMDEGRTAPRAAFMSSSASASSLGTSGASNNTFEAVGNRSMAHSVPSTAKTSVEETRSFAPGNTEIRSVAPLPRIVKSEAAMTSPSPFSSPYHRSMIPDQPPTGSSTTMQAEEQQQQTRGTGSPASLLHPSQRPTSPLLAQLQADGSFPSSSNGGVVRSSFASNLVARLTRSKSSSRSLVPNSPSVYGGMAPSPSPSAGPTTPKLGQTPSSPADSSPFCAPATERWAVSTTDSGIFSSRTARKQPAFLSTAAAAAAAAAEAKAVAGPRAIGLGLEEDDEAVLSETEELIRSGLPSPVGPLPFPNAHLIDRSRNKAQSQQQQQRHRRDESSIYEASPIMQDSQWHGSVTDNGAHGSPALLQDMASPASFQEAESISFSVIQGSLSPRLDLAAPEEAAKASTSPLGRFETLNSATNSRRQSLTNDAPDSTTSRQDATPRIRSSAQAVVTKTSTAMSSPAQRASVASSEMTVDAVAESIAETISLFSSSHTHAHAQEEEEEEGQQQLGLASLSTDDALSQRAELLRNVQKEVALAHAQRIKHAKRMEQERRRQEEQRRAMEKVQQQLEEEEVTEMMAPHPGWTRQHVQGSFVATGSTSGVLTQVLSNALLQRRPTAPASASDLAVNVAVSTQYKQIGFEGPLTPPLTPARPVIELQGQEEEVMTARGEEPMPLRPTSVVQTRGHTRGQRSDSPLRSVSTAIDLDSPTPPSSKMRPLNLVSSASSSSSVRASSSLSRPFIMSGMPRAPGSSENLAGSRRTSRSGSLSSSGSWAQLAGWGTPSSHITNHSINSNGSGSPAKRSSKLMGGGILPAISHESSPSFVIGSLPSRPPSTQSQSGLSHFLAGIPDSPTRPRPAAAAAGSKLSMSMSPIAPSASYRAAMQHHHEMASLAVQRRSTRISTSLNMAPNKDVGMAL